MLALGSVQEVIERQIKAGKVEFDIPGKASFHFFRCVEFFLSNSASIHHFVSKYWQSPISGFQNAKNPILMIFLISVAHLALIDQKLPIFFTFLYKNGL